MRQRGNISKKHSIFFRRRLNIVYSRFLFALKLALILFVYLFFFTDYFSKIKAEIIQEFYELSADAGFTLKNVSVDGQDNAEIAHILSILNADTGTPIFAINLNDVRDKLKLNDWIKDASIGRKLPNNIQIELLERVPIAIWQINNQLFLIDDDGYQITSNIEKFPKLLHLVGSDANIYAKELIQQLSRYTDIRNKVVSAVRYGERRWNLNLIQNITVKMPELGFDKALDYVDKLNKASKLFNENYKMIDLRDSDKYYIEKY